MTTETPSDTARFAERAERFAALLTTDLHRGAPTPCTGWSVRDVVDHVVATQRDFLVRQGLLAADAPTPTDFDAHRREVLDVLGRDDVAGRAYDGYFGPTTVGATMADFYGWDLLVHAWDVAAATGQQWDVSDAEAAELDATADGWGGALYGEGICAPAVAVPADAPARDRLLGRLGRDPSWRP
ncbi:maleylpyruvate isomerase N-terminal domain-containing protein [Nocardioides lentus]